MKKNGIGIIALVLLIGCGTEMDETTQDLTINEVKSIEEVSRELSEEDAYRLLLLESGIESKQAWAYQYKFGEPEKKGLLIYETKYDKNGNITDSIVYNSSKIAFHESYEYNSNNELIVRKLIDSTGIVVQKSERLFNKASKESGFVMYSGDSIYYKQDREYNEKEELIRLTETDARGIENGVAKLISEFSYDDRGNLLSKTELDNEGNIISKISYNYNADNDKVSISNYNSTGAIQGKTLLKNYENGKAQLVEKYDAYDSLYASYAYEYNRNGDETKSIIYNGIGQVIRQANTTIDEKGNKILFEIYEGEVGFLGKDEVKYNAQGQETELIVYDNNNQQVKRKLTAYNEKGLVIKEENFNKIDEPIYQFQYNYNYFK